MSRIGKNPVELPSGVTASMTGQQVEIKGPKGSLTFTSSHDVTIKVEGQSVTFKPRGHSKQSRQSWGLSRAMVANCVEGVTQGFRKELQITGVGYRAQLNGKTLTLSLGLSHEVKFDERDGLTMTVPSPTRIVIEGADKQKVGQLAADIRASRPPEPYKGKGICYVGEDISRKVGKKK